MLEYAISCGEGTLVDLGVFHSDDEFWPDIGEGETLIISLCADDCETGNYE